MSCKASWLLHASLQEHILWSISARSPGTHSRFCLVCSLASASLLNPESSHLSNTGLLIITLTLVHKHTHFSIDVHVDQLQAHQKKILHVFLVHTTMVRTLKFAYGASQATIHVHLPCTSKRTYACGATPATFLHAEILLTAKTMSVDLCKDLTWELKFSCIIIILHEYCFYPICSSLGLSMALCCLFFSFKRSHKGMRTIYVVTTRVQVYYTSCWWSRCTRYR